jgi:mRNA-degrading endonuclease RelE of RelBE toxin-antitoxin system
MKVPLEIVLTKNALKSLNALDAPTRRRVQEKIEAVAADPFNPANSYPLPGQRNAPPVWVAIAFFC